MDPSRSVQFGTKLTTMVPEFTTHMLTDQYLSVYQLRFASDRKLKIASPMQIGLDQDHCSKLDLA